MQQNRSQKKKEADIWMMNDSFPVGVYQCGEATAAADPFSTRCIHADVCVMLYLLM